MPETFKLSSSVRPTTSKSAVGFVVAIPTLPTEVTTNGFSDVPTCRACRGFTVPIPKLCSRRENELTTLTSLPIRS